MINTDFITSSVKEQVSKSFNKYQLNDEKLENAISEAIVDVLTNPTILRELTEVITEKQEFNKRRKERFR